MHFMKLAAIAALFALPFAGGVQAAPVAIECGPLIKSVVKTDIEFFTTSSELPVPLKGAAVSFSVPAGRTVCVRVRFSAIANCPLSCFLRAFVDNTQMNPQPFPTPCASAPTTPMAALPIPLNGCCVSAPEGTLRA